MEGGQALSLARPRPAASALQREGKPPLVGTRPALLRALVEVHLGIERPFLSRNGACDSNVIPDSDPSCSDISRSAGM